MSDFKSLKGLYIKHVSSDPANPISGQIWYNTTTQTLKVAPQIGSWAAGENMNTGRKDHAGAGIQTSAIAIAGQAPGGATANAETYDGTDWTEGPNLNTARNLLGGTGASSTAAIAFGGSPHTGATESYDGSSWTEGPDLNTARYGPGPAGTSTAALSFGGNVDPNNATDVVESYDGSSWTEVADLNTAKEQVQVVLLL